jgi:hypothetical protein
MADGTMRDTQRPRSTFAAQPSAKAVCSWYAKSATAGGRCPVAGRM